MANRIVISVCVTLALAAGSCNKEKRILGGIDGDAYCKSIGKERALWTQNPAQFDGKKTWGCEGADRQWAPLSIRTVCTAQYNTNAHGEQQRGDDPTSWLCVEGAAPDPPEPHWNRANL